MVPPFDLEVYAQERMKAAVVADEADVSGIRSTTDQLRPLRELMAKEEYELALALAQRLRLDQPDDIELAYYIEDCTLALVDRFEARLGSLDRIPMLAVKRTDVASLELAPLDAFLLAQMDGVLSLETMVDISGVGRLETLRHLVKLLDERIIEVY
ncbi:MAG: hypothetical protein JWM74_2184 [Myxococcaceae bacterium]|jgi:hypothetical protein|nr:hypothetical protein [Myxococcaceae bacterium]